MTPLGPGYSEEPFWWRAAPTLTLEHPDMAFPNEVDAVIVGGGYTGMMAAATLASRGRSVVLLEKTNWDRVPAAATADGPSGIQARPGHNAQTRPRARP